jgi:Ca2+-binding EF-hand superfamily protein
MSKGVIRGSSGNKTKENLTSLVPVLSFEGHEDHVRCIWVTPNDEVVTGSDDHTARQWDLRGNCVKTFRGHNGPVTSICCSDTNMFTGSADSTALMWFLSEDCAEHEEIYQPDMKFKGHEDEISAVACMGEGGLCTGSLDGSVRIWDLESGDEVASVPHSAGVTALVVKDYHLFTACANGIAKMWDAATGEWLRSFEPEGEKHPCVSLCVQGETLYSAWADNTVRAWDIEKGACTRTIPATGPLLASADGCVFVGNPPKGDSVKLWAEKAGAFAVLKGHRGAVNSAFATDKVLFTAGQDNVAKAYVIPPVPSSGFYEKKGGGTSIFGRRSWHQRYFTMREGKLSYYKEEPSKTDKSEPIGMLHLNDVKAIKTDKWENGKNYDLTMCLITDDREFLMRAGNKIQFEDWKRTVDAHLAYVRLVSRNELVDPVKEAARLSAEEQVEMEEVFDSMDIDGDGQLGQDEIEAEVHRIVEQDYDHNDRAVMDQKEAITQQVMAEFDADGDGQISKEEFQQAALKRKQEKQDREDAEEERLAKEAEAEQRAEEKRREEEMIAMEKAKHFQQANKLDADGDGKISAEEMRAAAARRNNTEVHASHKVTVVKHEDNSALVQQVEQLTKESTSRLQLAESLRQDMVELRAQHHREIERLSQQQPTGAGDAPHAINQLRLELLQERAERAREQEGYRQVLHEKEDLQHAHRREVARLNAELDDLRMQLETAHANSHQSTEMLNRTRLKMEEYELKMREGDDMGPKLMQTMTKLTVATKRGDSLVLQLDEQAAQHRTEISALKHELTAMAHQLEDALSGPMSPPRLKESYESKISSYELRITEMRTSYEIRITTAERRADEAREYHADLEADLGKAQSELKWLQESHQGKMQLLIQEKEQAMDQREDAMLERDEMERQVAQIQHKLEDALREIEVLRTMLSEAQHALQLERQKSQDLESELSRISIQISQTEAHADDLRAGEEAAARIYKQAMETMNAERESHSIEVRELKTMLVELRRHQDDEAEHTSRAAREFAHKEAQWRQQLADSRHEMETIISQRTVIEKELHVSRSEKSGELEILHEELESTRMNLRQLERVVSKSDEERGSLYEKIETLEIEITRTRDGSHHSEREMATLQDRCAYLEEMLNDMRTDRDSQASVVNGQFEELKMKQTEGSNLKAELSHLQESYKLIAHSESELREQVAVLQREGPRGKHQIVQAEHTLALMKDELEHTRKMAKKAGEELTAASNRHSDDMDMAMGELTAARSKQTEMAHQLRSCENEVLQLKEQLHRAELAQQRAQHEVDIKRTTRRGSHSDVSKTVHIDEFRSRVDNLITSDSLPAARGGASATAASHLDLSDHERLLKEAGSFHLDMGL